MTYQDALNSLAEDTQNRVAKVVAAYLAGHLAGVEFEAVIAAIILTAQDRGAVIADLSLASQVTAGTGKAIPVQGRLNPNRPEQVRAVIRTTIEASRTDDELATRLARIADNEPRYVARDTYQKSLQASRDVEGWTRGLDSDPCQLCVWWWRDGRVWPKNYPLQHHKGCQCTQVPVVTKHIHPVTDSRIKNRR